MITTSSTGTTSERRFPTLRALNSTTTHAPTIVLFTNDTTGTIIQGDAYLFVGYHNDEWNPGDFTDYFGSVTITNE